MDFWMSRCWNVANSGAWRDPAARRAAILEEGTTPASVEERGGADMTVDDAASLPAIGGAPSHELRAKKCAEPLGRDGEDDVAIVSACIASAGSPERVFELRRSEFLVVKAEAVDDEGAQESVQGRSCDSGQQTWPQMQLLPVSELKYTQKSINTVFRDGSTLGSLLRDLHSKKVDPTRHANMVLEVVKVKGTYYSNDNRRLNVLREYMHDLGREVYVQCRVFGWYHAYGRWLDRYRERTGEGLRDSDGIRLRNKRQLEPTAPAHPPPPHLRVTYLKKAMLQAANLQEPAVAEVGQGGKKRRSDGLQGIPMLDSQSSGSGHRP